MSATPLHRSAVALEHYKALRAEVVERLKMRDQVLLAYLGGTAALIGFSAATPEKAAALFPALLLLIPFLAVGAATCVGQHQDTITAFNEYIIHDLLRQLSDPPPQFYDSSNAAGRHAPQTLWTRFITQSAVICGPPALLVILAVSGAGPYGPVRVDRWVCWTSAALTLGAEFRLWWSKRYRLGIHKRIQTLPAGKAT